MGWQEDPVIGNWGLKRGKRTGLKSQPMPVADSPELVAPQAPATAAPSLAQPQSAAAPVQQQPQAPAAEQPQRPADQSPQPTPEQPPTQTPRLRQVKVGNTTYNLPADWSREQVIHWLNVKVAKPQQEGTKLDSTPARGRAMYYDPESHAAQRKATPISKEARAEYAPMIRRREKGGEPEEIKPDDVTPEVLQKYIANRKRISAIKTSGDSAEWKAWKNEYEQVAYDEDTAAMERDLERVWDNEDTATYQKRIQTFQAAKEAKQLTANFQQIAQQGTFTKVPVPQDANATHQPTMAALAQEGMQEVEVLQMTNGMEIPVARTFEDYKKLRSIIPSSELVASIDPKGNLNVENGERESSLRNEDIPIVRLERGTGAELASRTPYSGTIPTRDLVEDVKTAGAAIGAAGSAVAKATGKATGKVREAVTERMSSGNPIGQPLTSEEAAIAKVRELRRSGNYQNDQFRIAEKPNNQWVVYGKLVAKRGGGGT